MSYRAFLLENRRLLAVGFFLCYFSSFGQTFFVGVFGGALRREFGLTNGEFGSLYSFATLLSGMSLLVLGRGVDRHDLRKYTIAVCCGLVVACSGIALAPSAWVLFAALFTLRLSGQGLMSHVALTSMTRYFDANRAKAISLASIGFAVGEASWPRAAIAALETFDWREVWGTIAVIAGCVLVPLMLWLLRGHAERHREHVAAIDAAGAATKSAVRRQWTRAEVVRDPRFYLLVPAALAPPMIVTGMFFHQVRIAELREWSMALYGNSFIGFAVVQFVTALACGPVTDRRGAARVFPFALLPMAAGLAFVAAFDGAWVCTAYLVAMGVTAGAASTVTGALWAELYGVLHTGAIRALISALMVFSTALTPALMGFAFDAGVTVSAIAVIWIGYVAVSTCLAVIATGRSPRAAP